MEYKSVKINTLLMQESIFLDLYLKINDKYIKYTDKEFDSKSQIDKLSQKKVEEVFMSKEDYMLFAKDLAEKVEKNEQKRIEESLSEYAKDYNLLKDLFKDAIVMDEENVERAMMFNKEVVDNIESVKDLSSMLKNYKSKNTNSLVHKHITIMTAYSIMKKMKTFTHRNIDTVILAINLSDLLLDEEEFWKSYHTQDELKFENKILNHGLDVVNKLPNNTMFNNMGLTQLIKFHHERPDGSGYPFGVNHSRFGLMQVVYFLSEEIASRVIKKKMKTNSFEIATTELIFENSEYGDNFQKVLSVMQDLFISEGGEVAA